MLYGHINVLTHLFIYFYFMNQFIIDAGNVKEIYAKGDTIQGELRTEAALPDDGNADTKEGNYSKFTTERPTFAADDLLQELKEHGAVVRATPVIDQRGPIANLISSVVLWGLLIGVSVWAFRRIAKGAGGLGAFGMQRQVKPIEKTQVRVNFSDVAGIDEVKQQVDEIVISCAIPTSIAGWALVLHAGSCSKDRPAPARRCSPGPPRVKPRYHSSAPRLRSSSR